MTKEIWKYRRDVQWDLLKDVKKAMPFAYTEITNFSNGDAENVVAEEGV